MPTPRPSFLDSRRLDDFDYQTTPPVTPPTLGSGLVLPYRLDFMHVGSDVQEITSNGEPIGVQMVDERTYQLGVHDYFISIDLDPTADSEGTYSAKVLVYGLDDEDLEATLRYFERRIDYARKSLLAVNPSNQDLAPRWHQRNDLTCSSTPNINLEIQRHSLGTFLDHQVRYGAARATIVLEYHDGKAGYTGTAEEDGQAMGLTSATAHSYNDHWGPEGPLLNTNMHNDYTDADPFGAVWVGGELADGCSNGQMGIDTQFWLVTVADALTQYRTAGPGVRDAFESLMQRSFGNS